MGVKGLQAYVEQCCQEALVNVNLNQLARQYRKQHGRQPILVVDGIVLLRKFYNPGIPWVYGGEWLELFERIQAFLETLKNADIKSVFIFDGVVEQSKRATWLDRRKKERRLVSQVFEHIKRTGRHPDKRDYHIPPSVKGCIIKALKFLGAEVSRSSIDTDKEIFQYYKEHQCFGVLSHDSDFLIYDVDKYFYSEKLDFKTLHVKMYNKQVLCTPSRHFRQLLPLLACILGNNTISQNSLTRFHHWVTGIPRDGRLKFQTTVPCCAKFLASQGANQLSERLIYDIESQVFRFPGMQGISPGIFQQVIHDYTSTDEYAPSQPQQQEATKQSTKLNAPLVRHQDILEVISKRKAHGFVKKVLRCAETDCNMSFEDDSDRSMPSAALVLRPIRSAAYGVLFGVGSGTDPSEDKAEAGSNSGTRLVVGVNAVNEYYAYAGYSLKDPDVVAATPVDLPGGTPSLEDIWMKREDETLHLRQQVVLSCLYCSIDETLLLETLPRRYLALCCLVHYFVKNGPDTMMRECDVDAFIAQAVCIGLHTARSIWNLRVPRVDSRGVHMATIFMRGLSTFWEANASCADPFKMEDSLPWQCFDGKLFHIKYIMAQEGATVRALCQDNAQALEEFLLLKKCITMGTRMETKSAQP
ncbi:constitutive coactivator of peroxisome proliferator-activated receptor gamma-like isoform X1 [Amphiura filiformis]|uniref:constitutive coactivator of peroxisome proliferator-activated receptor gamma-like isoform X1 n=1 Tax=Amphiura filiformis TaxID=82378 RepID=UPI003B20C2A9